MLKLMSIIMETDVINIEIDSIFRTSFTLKDFDIEETDDAWNIISMDDSWVTIPKNPSKVSELQGSEILEYVVEYHGSSIYIAFPSIAA